LLHQYLPVRFFSMALEASSASANVLKGEPPILTAPRVLGRGDACVQQPEIGRPTAMPHPEELDQLPLLDPWYAP